MFVFTEPIISGCAASRSSAEHRAERLDLDRIAERGAGAVRLDVADRARRNARGGERRADHRLLRRPVRRGQAAAAPVLVDGACRGSPRGSRSPSAMRVAQPLEHDHRRSPRRARSRRRRRRTSCSGRRGAIMRALREVDVELGRQDQVDAAGQRQVALAARRLWQARCTATSDDEQAVSTAMLGPCSPRTYDSRPAATLYALPGAEVRIDQVSRCANERAAVVAVGDAENTPVGVPASDRGAWPASSSASQATSSSRRCCGSMLAASRGAMPKNSASKLVDAARGMPPWRVDHLARARRDPRHSTRPATSARRNLGDGVRARPQISCETLGIAGSARKAQTHPHDRDWLATQLFRLGQAAHAVRGFRPAHA